MGGTAAEPQRSAAIVLLLGATGFLGRSLDRELRAAGFIVIRAGHGLDMAARGMRVDYTTDHAASTWLPRLAGVHYVINAVGIFAEQGRQRFRAIHTDAPCALFSACASAGVRRVIQISALGADTGTTEYFRSKLRADECLKGLPLAWTIVRPSLVYGEDGRSSRLLHRLASLPVIPLPGGGAQQVQPIHVADLARSVVALMVEPQAQGRIVAAVGPRPLALRQYLSSLRTQTGIGRGWLMPVPMPLVNALAQVAGLWRGGLLSRDALGMLQQGSTADPAELERLSGVVPRDPDQFVPAERTQELRTAARLGWLLPLLRWSIALLWIWSAVVSWWIYPRDDSLALLAQAGIPAALQPATLLLAIAADLLAALACLLLWRRPWVWLLQIMLVLGYTAIITLWLPEFWMHPFGPVAKNVPVLAVLALLYFQARDRWNT
jgi:uncharacterized protein YbjT (DUF2867 family)